MSNELQIEDYKSAVDLSQCKRHPSSNFYIPDGNVAFVCQRTIFKTYRGLLSNHSEVFQSMLSVTDTTRNITKVGIYDKSPLFKLDDSAQDFEYFLSAVQELKYIDQERMPPFVALAGILRISFKYKAYRIWGFMVRHLERAYPSSFDQFEQSGLVGDAVFPVPHPHLHEVLNICFQFNLQRCLPFAYWDACFCGIDSLMEGDPEVPERFLKRSVLQTAVKGALTLKAREFEHVKQTFNSFSPNCECSKSVRRNKCILELLWISQLPVEDPDVPGSIFNHLLEPKSDDVDFCSNCRKFWRKRDFKGRREIWKDLPAFFNLSSLDDLVNGQP